MWKKDPSWVQHPLLSVKRQMHRVIEYDIHSSSQGEERIITLLAKLNRVHYITQNKSESNHSNE